MLGGKETGVCAKDIMTEEVIVIYEDMPIREVAHLMLRNRVSGFPVINKGVGLVGVVTMTDLFRLINKATNEGDEAFHHHIHDEKNLPVAYVMSKDVITIKPETTLDEIVHLLVNEKIHTFPVVVDRRIVGVVSRHDVLNAVFAYL